MNENKKNDKTTLIIWLVIMLAVFSGIFAVFYIYREDIYYFLHNNSSENKKNIPEKDSALTPRKYLENIVFIGDSIMQGLDIYRDSIDFRDSYVLENVTIAASVGYGLRHALSDVSSNAVNLIYEDKPMKPEDIISQRDEN